MEYVPCGLCGADDAHPLIIKNDYNVLECNRCQLVYVNPRPTPLELEQIYSSNSRPLMDAHTPAQRWNVRKFSEALNLLHKFLPEPGRLLDVGCYTGIFMQMAEQQGWQVSGIDVGRTAVEYASKRGLDVKCCGLQPGTYPENSFDAVTLFDSIEHMPAPLEAFRIVWQITRPGGFVLVTTPNINGFIPQTTFRIFGNTIGAWEHPTPPHHIYQFSEKTIRLTVEKAGWEVKYSKTRPIPFVYSAGNLENALIDAVKRNNGGLPLEPDVESKAGETKTTKASVPAQKDGSKMRHLARLGVRFCTYAFLGLLFPISIFTNKMDSLMLVAQKPQH